LKKIPYQTSPLLNKTKTPFKTARKAHDALLKIAIKSIFSRVSTRRPMGKALPECPKKSVEKASQIPFLFYTKTRKTPAFLCRNDIFCHMFFIDMTHPIGIHKPYGACNQSSFSS
jgi:hypothetical protein